jgi:hypothetical protein
MSGGMAFRKDCEDCGHSFLTMDRKAKLCPRCAGKGRKKEQTEKVRTPGHISEKATAAKTTDGQRPPSPPINQPGPPISKKREPLEIQEIELKSKMPKGVTGSKPSQTHDVQVPVREKPEIVLTEGQTQEIIARYQAYVQIMERPARGRRKTIAAEMGIPHRAVVLALRSWNQSQGRDLNREERFSVEKTYFSFMENENSFSQLKDRICRETGLDPWSVSRYLDILHDGEDKLKVVPDVSLEQRTAILAEYKNYLNGFAPPDPFLHPMIAEKTGVDPKQVYKILLTYRLNLFNKRWRY